jgi:hypothetical protein
MSETLPPPGQDDEEFPELAGLVAENLAKGESPEEIVQQLVDSGWQLDDAQGLVGTIQRQLHSAQQQPAGGGEGMGWLVWIGGIVLINVLSYLFNWNFWIW